MLVALGALVLGLFVLLAVVGVAIARWSAGEARKVAAFQAPDMHTVTYVVPDGEDPVGVIAALTHAGFRSVEDHSGLHDRVVVECPPDRREQVRAVIAHVQHHRFDGVTVTGRVVFEDER